VWCAVIGLLCGPSAFAQPRPPAKRPAGRTSSLPPGPVRDLLELALSDWVQAELELKADSPEVAEIRKLSDAQLAEFQEQMAKNMGPRFDFAMMRQTAETVREKF
jgi:hypothetical protein